MDVMLIVSYNAKKIQSLKGELIKFFYNERFRSNKIDS
jgi:hypothetical protein